MRRLRIGMAQINTTVGDFAGNIERILEAIAEGKGPELYLIALGYAGWGEGQLEKEIISNAWLNTPYDEHILYKTPVKQRWTAAANEIGIDISLLTTPAGHS